MLSSTRFLAATCAALFLFACGGADAPAPGDSSSTTPAATDPTPPAGTGTAAAPPAVTPPAAGTPPATPPATPPTATCNPIANDGPIVGASMVAANAPAPTGGALVNGHWHLHDIVVYTGPGGSSGPLALSIAQTVDLHGNVADIAQVANGKTDQMTETMTTSGTTVSYARVCPATGEPQKDGQFSATPTSMILYLPNDVGQIVAFTYDR